MKRIYDVGNASRKEAQEAVDKMLEEYGSQNNKYDDNVDIPIREEKINLGYGDYYQGDWYEKDKAKETNPERDKNDIVLDSGVVFADWNKFSMDELADYLEHKWQFMSSGEALAIMKMVDFYRENKNK